MGNDKRDKLKQSVMGLENPVRSSRPPVPPSIATHRRHPPSPQETADAIRLQKSAPRPAPDVDLELIRQAWVSNKQTMEETLTAIGKNEDNNRFTRRVSYVTMLVVICGTVINVNSNNTVLAVAEEANAKLTHVVKAMSASNQAELAEERLEDSMMLAEPFEEVRTARAAATVYALKAEIATASSESAKVKARAKLKKVAKKAKSAGVDDDVLSGLDDL
jgi:hypothetical protein